LVVDLSSHMNLLPGTTDEEQQALIKKYQQSVHVSYAGGTKSEGQQQQQQPIVRALAAKAPTSVSAAHGNYDHEKIFINRRKHGASSGDTADPPDIFAEWPWHGTEQQIADYNAGKRMPKEWQEDDI
jgi:hypothetical protein